MAKSSRQEGQESLEHRRASEFHEALHEAGQLYERYLDVAQVGDVGRLAMEAQSPVTPPRSDLPLTLEIHTNS